MTAGGGIAHSEQSPDPHSPMLHGAQLWVALAGRRARAGAVVRAPPRAAGAARAGRDGDGAARGAGRGPLAGAGAHRADRCRRHARERGADAVLPLEGDFEHAVLTVSGAPEVDGGELAARVAVLPRHGPVDAAAARGDAEPAAAPRRDPVHREDRDVVELHRAHGGGDRRGARPLAGGAGGGADCDVRRERQRSRSGPARSAPSPVSRVRRSQRRRCRRRRCARAAAPVETGLWNGCDKRRSPIAEW